MDNLGTLCLLGIILIAAMFLLPRLLGGRRAMGGSRGVRPTYNDPDIGSRASFGAPEQPEFDSPEIRSRSAFGLPLGRRRRTSSPQNVSRGATARRVDSPKIRSRAGFGRKRK